MFARQELSRYDYETLEQLRTYYRNRRRVDINSLEMCSDDRMAVPYLSDFLEHIEFVPKVSRYLYKDELEYLTGGWFEEYVYYFVQRYIKPQDLALSVIISRGSLRHNNELDVVFTKGNKLFVIECKTGVQTERLFNEIVYKVCAIREALLGVSCYSYIFSLKRDDTDVLKRIADNMDITFVDYDILTTSRKLNLTIKKIESQAKE